jgi:hypothetical protein
MEVYMDLLKQKKLIKNQNIILLYKHELLDELKLRSIELKGLNYLYNIEDLMYT